MLSYVSKDEFFFQLNNSYYLKPINLHFLPISTPIYTYHTIPLWFANIDANIVYIHTPILFASDGGQAFNVQLVVRFNMNLNARIYQV